MNRIIPYSDFYNPSFSGIVTIRNKHDFRGPRITYYDGFPAIGLSNGVLVFERCDYCGREGHLDHNNRCYYCGAPPCNELI